MSTQSKRLALEELLHQVEVMQKMQEHEAIGRGYKRADLDFILKAFVLLIQSNLDSLPQ